VSELRWVYNETLLFIGALFVEVWFVSSHYCHPVVEANTWHEISHNLSKQFLFGCNLISVLVGNKQMNKWKQMFNIGLLFMYNQALVLNKARFVEQISQKHHSMTFYFGVVKNDV
jgi:hypothetical protein